MVWYCAKDKCVQQETGKNCLSLSSLTNNTTLQLASGYKDRKVYLDTVLDFGEKLHLVIRNRARAGPHRTGECT